VVCPNCGASYEGKRCPNCGRPAQPRGCLLRGATVVLAIVTPFSILGTCAILPGLVTLVWPGSFRLGLSLLAYAVATITLSSLVRALIRKMGP
jgi:hypothetical protein